MFIGDYFSRVGRCFNSFGNVWLVDLWMLIVVLLDNGVGLGLILIMVVLCVSVRLGKLVVG